MKLPAIRYKTGVERLASISPQKVVSTGMMEIKAAGAEALAVGRDRSGRIGADAASEFAMYGATLAGVNAGLNMVDAYLNRQNDIETASANQAMAEEMTKWIEGPGTQEFFTSDEVAGIEGVRLNDTVTDINGLPIEVPRDRIPAYEVRAELYKRKVEEAIKAHSEKITAIAVSKDMWVADRRLKAEQNYAQIKGKSIIQQHEYNRKTQNQNITEYLQTGKYALALKTALKYDGTEAEIQAQITRVRVGTETYSYDDAASRESLEDINNSISILENPDYYRTGGMLDDRTRHMYLDHLRATRSRIMKAGLAELNVDHTELMDEIRRTKNEMQSGQMKHNIAYTSNLMARAKETGLGVGNTTKAAKERILLKDFYMSINETNFDAAMNLAPTSVQELELNRLRLHKDDTPYASERYQRTLTLVNANKALMQKNPVDYGVEKQFIKPVGGIQWANLKDMKPKLLALKNNARMVEQRFHHFKGYLSSANEDELKMQIQNAGYAEKQAIIKNINLALPGTDAQVVYDQLAASGLEGSFMIAGSMAAKGFAANSDLVLKGQEVRINRPKFFEEKNAGFKLQNQMTNELKNYAHMSPRQRKQVDEAIFDYYAGAANGDSNYTMNRGSAAINAVKPNLMTFKNAVITRAPDATDQENTHFFKNIHPMYIGSSGGVEGHTDAQATYGISDGVFEPMDYGDGQWIFYDPSQHAALLSARDPSQPFILKYDIRATDWKTISMKKEVAAVDPTKKVEPKKDTSDFTF